MIRLKTREEIETIRKAGRILAETLKLLSEKAVAGVTTKELDRWAYDFIISQGAEPAFLGYNDYPASVCFAINNAVIHGIPDKTRLLEGDIVGIDIGVRYHGLISDSAQTLAIGGISAEASRLMQVTRECLELGIGQARVGNRVKDISRAIYEHAVGNGYSVVTQFCGHGVGFDVHEDPQVPNYIGRGPNPRLKNGMVLAIEPMVNIGKGDVEILPDGWTVVTSDGSLSAHFEHTIAFFEGETEILTIL